MSMSFSSFSSSPSLPPFFSLAISFSNASKNTIDDDDVVTGKAVVEDMGMSDSDGGSSSGDDSDCL